MTSAPLTECEAEFLSILDQLTSDQIRELASACCGQAEGRLPEMADLLRSLADFKDRKRKLDEAA